MFQPLIVSEVGIVQTTWEGKGLSLSSVIGRKVKNSDMKTALQVLSGDLSRSTERLIEWSGR